MKNNRFWDLLCQFAAPVAVMLLGLILVLSPDSASILIARILGWGLTIVGIGFGVAAIVDRDSAIRKGITAVAFACVGGTLSANPLLLAAWIGRIIGLLIAIRGRKGSVPLQQLRLQPCAGADHHRRGRGSGGAASDHLPAGIFPVWPGGAADWCRHAGRPYQAS